MRKKPFIALAGVTTIFVASILILAMHSAYAMRGVTQKGDWPEEWPKELEPLRNQSITQWHTHQGGMHEISFASREEFESAWPHILSVKSKDAPLILLSSPYTRTPKPITAGVRILTPATGTLVTEDKSYTPERESAIPEGKFLRIGPPWPDYVKSESGVLPEFVIFEDGKWALYERKARENTSAKKATIEERREEVRVDFSIRRARIDIELIVDGEIVDLNRIPLPADTQIIDNRFQEGHNREERSTPKTSLGPDVGYED